MQAPIRTLLVLYISLVLAHPKVNTCPGGPGSSRSCPGTDPAPQKLCDPGHVALFYQVEECNTKCKGLCNEKGCSGKCIVTQKGGAGCQCGDGN
ncbi:unnamed protein product [Cercospora beticola]|nr:unnamed protein product [Cercospora beticola]